MIDRTTAARPRLIRRAGAALLGTAALLLVSEATVSAAWPPASGASAQDLKNPDNWPNDPGYGYVASSKPSERKKGQWQFYSFIPDRSPGAPELRPQETASGMSIDLAWRHTIGDDRVLIAVLDSGIRWDESDLVEKAYLNKGELASFPPLHADSSPCAPLDPQKPTEDLFDCNGDGILTVGDYADHPGLQPDATQDHPKGDKNQNGLLDAGDLILNFSDGKDDDGNGYVDDISGWDFMKDDNDPYDDTRYGHGTGEARDSSAATNNGQGDAGVCPACRFMLLRVGDSFIANTNDFGQAVVYATDKGASVIQEALGTINMSSFAQSAMDYAWKNGTVVVASMADENSRHHNYPATANHTMPVHAITMLGSDEQSTTARSFLSFNTCTNYGGQNFLSASGTGCSSEATGRLSGISGLVYSMAKQSNLTPPLSAGEAMQLFTMTAEDIDIPESREGNTLYFWSQEGFDQRFGYGRINANTAVEWVKEGRIPPDVDIVRPYWFETLYKDQVTQPVPIMGTVSARRANSYDVFVEWAPGVQPLDSAFKLVKKMENIPSSTVLGEDGTPLAELEVRDIDPSHEPDIDSPHGENKYTITVRVRSVAHYGGSIGDVPGELRRTYAVHEDPDLLDGFPVYLGGSGESSPKLVDIDGDGMRDIVIATSDGKLNVFSLASGKPTMVAGFPALANRIRGLLQNGTPSYLSAPGYTDPKAIDPDKARESISTTPAIADIDDDGKPEIVFTSYEGTIYAVNHDGTPVSGFPVALPDVPSCALDQPKDPAKPCMDTVTRIDRGAFGSPVIEDLDGDGTFEIIQAAFDGKVYVFEPDGKPRDGWPVQVHHSASSDEEYNRIMTTPTVADFNGDGVKDVVVGSNERLGKGGGSGAFFMIDGRGNLAGDPPYLPHWPVTMVSFQLFPLVAEGVPNSPVSADMTGDGKPEVIFHGNASSPLILPVDPGTQQTLGSTPTNALPERTDPNTGEPARGIEPTSIFGPDSQAVTPDTMFPLFAQPSLGDLDQDGTPDVVSSGGSLSMAGSLLSSKPSDGPAQHLLAMWSGKTGAMLPASPVVLEDFTFFNNQAIADLTGDGYPEVLTGSGGYYVHAVDACGREAEGWPKFTGQWVIATTAVGDVDGDDKLEVVVNSRSGWLYAWHTKGTTDGVITWESFHHDNRNTGNLDVPLDQGKLMGAATPLELDSEGKCVQAEEPTPTPATKQDLSPEGGCGCSVPSSRRTPTALLGLLAALGLLFRRRRRS
ncbi:MAG: VCBS repeat-containing protein [Myxococcales bacterium]|nr:VCBS repeat-containing protein [Myxococcales bacterium]MCB9576736.1 VCBS repeat-containing protein [Polyangiaceae bacterium]